MVAFSSIRFFQIRLPAGDRQTSALNLVVFIRDQSDSVTEYNMSSTTVTSDSTEINLLINSIQISSKGITNNPVAYLLASGNQNTVGQVISSISQQLNQMDVESLDGVVAGK